MTTVNALMAASTATVLQPPSPPKDVSASHFARPVLPEATPSEKIPLIRIRVSQDVASCASFQVNKRMPGRNMTIAPHNDTVYTLNAGTHVLAIHSTSITLMIVSVFHSLVLMGPMERSSF